jgi:hypothetical protein
MIQGMTGLVLSVVFLKWSSFGKFAGKGWLASTIVHGFFNTLVTIIAKNH